MEAKETVMNWGKLSKVMQEAHKKAGFPDAFYSVSVGAAVAKEQAEISFAAGEKEGYGKGEQEGREEVVEWIEKQDYSSYITGKPSWQQKLKEWGINEKNI